MIVHYTDDTELKFLNIIQSFTDGAMLVLVRYEGSIYIDRYRVAWFYIPNKRVKDTLDRMIENCVISYEEKKGV